MDTNIEKIQAAHTLAQIVNGNSAEFSHYKLGVLYYSVEVEGYKYEFPISVIETDYMLSNEPDEDEIEIIKLSSDIGESTFEKKYKAITLMRYIRKAIADGELRWDKII